MKYIKYIEYMHIYIKYTKYKNIAFIKKLYFEKTYFF